MTSKILLPSEKHQISEYYEIHWPEQNKTEIAANFDISPRSLGRIINQAGLLDDMTQNVYTHLYDLGYLVAPSTPMHVINLEPSIIDLCEDYYGVKYIQYAPEPVYFSQFVERLEENKSSGSVGFDYTPGDISIDLEDDEDEDEEDFLDDVVDDQEESHSYELVATNKQITVIRSDGQHREIDASNPKFRDAWMQIRDTDMLDQDDVNATGDDLFTLADAKTTIEKFSYGQLTVSADSIFWGDYQINNKLTNRILEMLQLDGFDATQPILNFLNNVIENPSNRSVNCLYDFLRHNDIKINVDGNFFAWKKVSEDFMDCYSGTLDNSPGKTVSMPRNMVNEDPNVTCSHGLHVGAYEYMKVFGGARMVKVEVNPRDVVAVPYDYNNSKLRCCRYVVIEDVTNMNIY